MEHANYSETILFYQIHSDMVPNINRVYSALMLDVTSFIRIEGDYEADDDDNIESLFGG